MTQVKEQLNLYELSTHVYQVQQKLSVLEGACNFHFSQLFQRIARLEYQFQISNQSQGKLSHENLEGQQRGGCVNLNNISQTNQNTNSQDFVNQGSADSNSDSYNSSLYQFNYGLFNLAPQSQLSLGPFGQSLQQPMNIQNSQHQSSTNDQMVLNNQINGGSNERGKIQGLDRCLSLPNVNQQDCKMLDKDDVYKQQHNTHHGAFNFGNGMDVNNLSKGFMKPYFDSLNQHNPLDNNLSLNNGNEVGHQNESNQANSPEESIHNLQLVKEELEAKEQALTKQQLRTDTYNLRRSLDSKSMNYNNSRSNMETCSGPKKGAARIKNQARRSSKKCSMKCKKSAQVVDNSCDEQEQSELEINSDDDNEMELPSDDNLNEDDGLLNQDGLDDDSLFNDSESLLENECNKVTNRSSSPNMYSARKTLGFDYLKMHFSIGLKEAARLMGVCPTTLKRSCRRHGIKRWPARQVLKLYKSLGKAGYKGEVQHKVLWQTLTNHFRQIRQKSKGIGNVKDICKLVPQPICQESDNMYKFWQKIALKRTRLRQKTLQAEQRYKSSNNMATLNKQERKKGSSDLDGLRKDDPDSVMAYNKFQEQIQNIQKAFASYQYQSYTDNQNQCAQNNQSAQINHQNDSAANNMEENVRNQGQTGEQFNNDQSTNGQNQFDSNQNDQVQVEENKGGDYLNQGQVQDQGQVLGLNGQNQGLDFGEKLQEPHDCDDLLSHLSDNIHQDNLIDNFINFYDNEHNDGGNIEDKQMMPNLNALD